MYRGRYEWVYTKTFRAQSIAERIDEIRNRTFVNQTKMEPGQTPFPGSRVDLANLKQLSGGDTAFEVKYITNFLNTVPLQLNRIETALVQDDGNLLYNTLHLLKAQLAFYGIKSAFAEIGIIEQKLHDSKEITELVKKSTNFIFKEITLACAEFETIKNNYQ
jgi:hypothetical protein